MGCCFREVGSTASSGNQIAALTALAVAVGLNVGADVEAASIVVVVAAVVAAAAAVVGSSAIRVEI